MNSRLLAFIFVTGCSANEGSELTRLPEIIVENRNVATNYEAGVGFVPGGTDKAPFESPLITDASRLIFANSNTDPFTYNNASAELGDFLQVARERLNPSIRLRFLTARQNPENRLKISANEVQLIVNQYYETGNHHLLATWCLPPGWSPQKNYVVMIFTGGMGHSNNSKLFGEPLNGFFEAFCFALQNSSSKSIILLKLNCGGRTASGLQPGWEVGVNKALAWGKQNLGADREKLILSGASRGGYASFVLGCRLQSYPENSVRGIFSSVFGSATQESQHNELVPSDLQSKFRLTPPEYIKRLVFSNDLLELYQYGPLGSVALLKNHPDKAEIQVYAGFGSADPTMLFSSSLLLYKQLKAEGINAKFEMLAGGGHDSFDEDRNMRAAQMAAELSDFRPHQFINGYSVMIGDRVINQVDHPIVHLRVPPWLARTIDNGFERSGYFELMGPQDTPYEVKIVNSSEEVLNSWTGVMNSAEYRWLEFPIPPAGVYKVFLSANGKAIGSETFSVAGSISPEQITGEWRPEIMPVIFNRD